MIRQPERLPDVDPVRRMRVMAAALPTVFHVEELIDASFADVWVVVSDLEGELPYFVPSLRSFSVEPGSRHDRRSAVAHGRWGLQSSFDVLLQPGWCLMQSDHVFVGMAAVAEGRGTRFAVFAGARHDVLNPLSAVLHSYGGYRAHLLVERIRARVAARAAGRGAEDR